jgi:channel protein (hemolysin III family)
MSTPTKGMPAGVARTDRQVTASETAEPLVPRLRGLSHAFAFVLSVAAAAVLIPPASPGRATAAAAIYGAGLIALFGGSAVYHRWPGQTRLKSILQRIDHSTIFVFIAASYTPIALIVLHGPLVWILLSIAWMGAATGVAFSLGWIEAPRAVIAGGYLALGWVAVIAIPPAAWRAASGGARSARGRRRALLDRRHHLREAAPRPMATYVRIPRDLPCPRDRRGCRALHRRRRLDTAGGVIVTRPTGSIS